MTVMTQTSPEHKMAMAIQMREQGKTLQEIADSLGYADPSAVSKMIKKHEETQASEARQAAYETQVQALRRSEAELRKQVRELEQKNSALAQAANSHETTATTLVQSHQSLEQELGQSQAELAQREFQLAQVQDKLEQVSTKLDDTRFILAQEQETLATIMHNATSTESDLAAATAQVAAYQAAEEKRRRHRFVDFFKGNVFMTGVVLAGAISLACAITAPIFVTVGVGIFWAYLLALYVDLAVFIFIVNGRHRQGIFFSIITGIQVFIKLGGMALMDPAWLQITKAGVLGLAIVFTTYGFSELVIATMKKGKES